MSYLLRVITFLFVSIWIVQPTVGKTWKSGPDFFETGIALEAQYGWEAAMSHWLQVRDSLDRVGKHDPRIGFEVIRIVTEQRNQRLFQVATDMYYWGLRADSVAPFQKELREELLRIQPLLPYRTFTDWNGLLKDENPEIYDHLLSFWLDRDPTPSEITNPRLLEHWMRIAHARHRFTRNSNSPYGTDDRGTVYVRFGQPDHIRRGTLTLNRFQVEYWARSIIETTGVTPSPEDLRNIVQLTEQIHEFPEFEVWVYRNLTNSRSSQEHIIYLFGSSPSIGGFRQLQSLDQFIPSRAYSSRRFSLGDLRVSIATFLQLAYYQQLSAVDPFFGNTFVTMENDAISLQQSSINQARVQSNLNRIAVQERFSRAPDEISDFENLLHNIPIRYQTYRFLGDENTPVLLVFQYSDMQDTFLRDAIYLERYPEIEPKYQLLHNVRARDPSAVLLANTNDFPETVLEFDPFTGDVVEKQSIFVLAHPKAGSSIRLSASLTDPNRGHTFISDTPFRKSVLATGRRVIQFPEPYPTTSDIMVSDLIIGYGNIQDELLQQAQESEVLSIPFYVPPKPVIPLESGVSLLFETYNITTNDAGLGEYTITYRLQPYTWLGRLALRDLSSLTLHQISKGSRNRDIIEIDLSDMEPGRYRLQLEIKDVVTGHIVIRNQEIQLIDTSEAADD